MKGKYFFLFGIILLLLNDANAATTIDDAAFGTIYDAFVAWMQGSLGYTISLLGTLSFLIYYLIGGGMFGVTNGRIFFVGVIFSLFVGGVVGIVQTMFGLGAGTFN